MTNTETRPVAPEWLVPGAEVVVIHGRYQDETVIPTTVARVYKRYFTVAHESFAGGRFSLDRQERRGTGTWAMTTQVLQRGSPEATRYVEASRKRRLLRVAKDACVEWHRNPVRAARVAAIRALEAVED